MPDIALLLQGGGALGAYELGVLRHMQEKDLLPVSMVAGISIGSVNTAVLVGSRNPDPVAALDELWRKLTVPDLPFAPQFVEENLALWGNRHMSRLRTDFWNAGSWTSVYSAEPLRELLHELVDFDKLNNSDTIVQLSAVQIESGEITTFSNRNGQRITADHVIASLSIPPMFPPVEIDGYHYWDGGLFDNAPLGAMINGLPADSDARFIIVNLFPLKGLVPQNLQQVQDRMTEIIFSNKVLGDMERMQDLNQMVELYAALDQTLPANSPIRQLAGFKDIERLRTLEAPVIITNNMPEAQSATLDFSPRSIAARIKTGYRDAVEALKDYSA
ncbi:patatin-like phospholipase family protein [Chitinilyticum piscinae]|uniref:Patatin-like phospholipase family protein n=1 Tax=Chitinilyticum piscinae TaxID=2866724 RepID=A0A8J7KGU0_9NEIS|nr:patatin-like phospholipase family protein [Chitinilyticum piscinae]MBE9610704.1 patatin-like phospholipase family protein [Chitinilyticum piscinae]